jgi:hypothetical protein
MKSKSTPKLNMLNRSIAVIKPKQPFLVWIHSIPDLKLDDLTLEEIRSGDSTAFLLPECDTLEEAQAYVDKIHKTIFQVELEGWWTDPADWPQKMTIKMFHEWFDIELNSMLIDTVNEDYLVMEY